MEIRHPSIACHILEDSEDTTPQANNTDQRVAAAGEVGGKLTGSYGS
jgi:hypothetical protein